MNFHEGMIAIGKATFTKRPCPACASPVLIPEKAPGSFCHLCEFYVPDSGGRGTQPDKAFQLAVAEATSSLAKGDWAALESALEPFAQAGAPEVLYGVGSIYYSLSDYVYNDINYSLGGFMYRNADNRSDEPGKNKYNSMALLSKAKGLLFNSLYLIGKMPEKEQESWLFARFIANIKLKRYPQAAKALGGMAVAKTDETTFAYAEMAYAVESHEPSAGYILPVLSKGHMNSLYYLARRLIRKGDYRMARESLSLLLNKTASPMASKVLRNLKGLEEEIRV